MTLERRELLADVTVHALGLALAAAGVVAMLVVAAQSSVDGQLLPVTIYLAGLLAMLGCSAIYHVWRSCQWRDWLRRLDHAAIFAMIAGTYTPFTLKLERAWATGLTAGIWTMAALGIAAKLWRPRALPSLSVALYLALGWIGLGALGPFTSTLALTTLLLLALGGVLYSAGVIFHLWQRLPYQNAIWHGFVLVAAGVHYSAVLTVVGA